MSAKPLLLQVTAHEALFVFIDGSVTKNTTMFFDIVHMGSLKKAVAQVLQREDFGEYYTWRFPQKGDLVEISENEAVRRCEIVDHYNYRQLTISQVVSLTDFLQLQRISRSQGIVLVREQLAGTSADAMVRH